MFNLVQVLGVAKEAAQPKGIVFALAAKTAQRSLLCDFERYDINNCFLKPINFT